MTAAASEPRESSAPELSRARRAPGRHLRSSPLAAAAVALVLTLLARLPARSLPLEGDAVAYGALARALAHGEGYTIDGVPHDKYPPLWPAIVAVPVVLGSTVTSAERGVAWALGGLASALTVWLGARLARGRLSLPLLVALTAFHPALALFAGGLVPGSEAATLCVGLAVASLGLSRRRTAGVVALGLAGLLPLLRFDALPFALAALACGWMRAEAGSSRWRDRGLACLLTIGPLLAWLVRTWIVAGSPLGHGYDAHVLRWGRVPGNLLVLAGFVLPAAGLGVLWPFVPRGLKAMWSAPVADRLAVRAMLVAVAAQLGGLAFLAGPGRGGGDVLAWSSGSLRFGLAVVPLVLASGLLGLEAAPRKVARLVGAMAVALAVPLGVYLVAGGLQRALPVRPAAAARLHALAEAFDRAAAEAGPRDWIAIDLERRTNAGVEVFLGDRAPSRRTGVVAADPATPVGRFPRPAVLPMADGFPKGGQVILVTDRILDGVIYTGDRPDWKVGGQGIFHRVLWTTVDGGAAGRYDLHYVRRPSK